MKKLFSKSVVSLLFAGAIVFSSASTTAATPLWYIGKQGVIKFYACQRLASDGYGRIVKVFANTGDGAGFFKMGFDSTKPKTYLYNGATWRNNFLEQFFMPVRLDGHTYYVSKTRFYVPYGGYFWIRLYNSDTKTTGYGPWGIVIPPVSPKILKNCDAVFPGLDLPGVKSADIAN